MMKMACQLSHFHNTRDILAAAVMTQNKIKLKIKREYERMTSQSTEERKYNIEMLTKVKSWARLLRRF